MNNMENYEYKTFEEIKHVRDDGTEFWYARELQKALEYTKWTNFLHVIDKAREACRNAGNVETSHFADVGKIIDLGIGEREVQDIELSRYACYLIVQNSDPNKEVVALGQTYFAVQTRRQELSDQFDTLTEDQKRLAIRGELIDHNKSLSDAARDAGVETPRDFAIFHNKGYQGLYGGLGQKEIHARKGLKKSQKILDYMGSTELAANLFRATQTDEKLRRDKPDGKEKANQIHYDVGKKVRQTIAELGGTMPEDLPTPDKSIKAIRREQQNMIESVDDDETGG